MISLRKMCQLILTISVSSDILIGVAKEFKVSTDYILGLSTVSVRKSYDISELGLSEGAVRGLVTGAVDVQILNRLLEHRNFPKLIDLIRIYFQDAAAKGIYGSHSHSTVCVSTSLMRIISTVSSCGGSFNP